MSSFYTTLACKGGHLSNKKKGVGDQVDLVIAIVLEQKCNLSCAPFFAICIYAHVYESINQIHLFAKFPREIYLLLRLVLACNLRLVY